MPDLVTGAAGFIGRNLCARLLSSGRQVRGLALAGEDTSAVDSRVEIVRGDVTEPTSLGPALAGVETVYHLAAAVGDWGPDAWFERVNVGGTRNVLEAAAAAGCGRVVQTSSIVVYGAALLGDRCDERQRSIGPGVGPYSRTKKAAEAVALDYFARGKVAVSVVRPGNVYGPESTLWVHEMVRQLRHGLVPLIDGGAGNACLAHVDNVVDVLVRAGSRAEAVGKVYNANDGSGITWRQYLTDLARIAGASAPSLRVPGQIADGIARLWEKAWRLAGASSRPLLTREAVMLLRSRAIVPIERAKHDLGYQPLVTYGDAMQGIERRLQEER